MTGSATRLCSWAYTCVTGSATCMCNWAYTCMTGGASVLQEAIREKTLNLDGPLLEDGTMLESLMACQSNVQRNRLILEETRFMGDHLQGKFAHYLPLMMEATVLYNTLRRMTVLHPMYYIPFYKFVDIFASVLKSRDRGKGSLGKQSGRNSSVCAEGFTGIEVGFVCWNCRARKKMRGVWGQWMSWLWMQYCRGVQGYRSVKFVCWNNCHYYICLSMYWSICHYYIYPYINLSLLCPSIGLAIVTISILYPSIRRSIPQELPRHVPRSCQTLWLQQCSATCPWWCLSSTTTCWPCWCPWSACASPARPPTRNCPSLSMALRNVVWMKAPCWSRSLPGWTKTWALAFYTDAGFRLLRAQRLRMSVNVMSDVCVLLGVHWHTLSWGRVWVGYRGWVTWSLFTLCVVVEGVDWLQYSGVFTLCVVKGWMDCSILESSLSLLLFRGWIDCSILESSLSVLLFQAWIAVLWSLFTLCVAVSGVDWLQYSGVSSPPSPWIV